VENRARTFVVSLLLDFRTGHEFAAGKGRVGERLLAKPPRDIVVPALVAYELRYGVARL
jgi:hypothetical protein